MARRDIQSFVIPLCRKMADEMGYEFINAELVKEGPGHYLRIYLDKDGGFTLDDCERFHRAVQPKLEVVEYDFLEVSSPGVDRPLTTERDFARAVGSEIEIRLYKPQDGAKIYQGKLQAYDENSVRILTAGGERSFLRREAALVKPVIVFEDEGESDE